MLFIQHQAEDIFTREEKYSEDGNYNETGDDNNEEKSEGDDDVIDDQQEEGEYLLGDDGPTAVAEVYIFSLSRGKLSYIHSLQCHKKL